MGKLTVIHEEELKKINDELLDERWELMKREKKLKESNKSEKEKLEEYKLIVEEYEKLEERVINAVKKRIIEGNEEFSRYGTIRDQVYMNSLRAQAFYMKLIIKEHEEKMEGQNQILKEHDKNILNIMGIFLAIFSLIGFNISFLPEIPDYFGGWQIIGFAALINIIIVISISCLFLLINYITKK